MASLGIDGLVSGLDTTSIINSLMTAEAAPQTQLKTQLTTVQSKLTDLQSLNASIKSIADAAAALSKPGGLQLFDATSSSTAVSVTAGSTAAAGSLSMTVQRLASSQVSVTAAQSVWPADPPVLTIVGSDGVSHEITASSTSIADVANAINKSGTGVTATQVSAGTVNGVPQYRLQLTSATGAASSFSIYQGGTSDVAAGTATDLLTQPGAATVSQAQDAQVVLWGGSAAEQTVTSKTNTFTGIMPGVDVTVSAVTTSPATVSVSPSNSQIAGKVGSLLTSVIGVFSTIAAKSAVSTTTANDQTTASAAGNFTGDSTVRMAQSQLFSAISGSSGSITPSTLGITITRDGTFTFDASVLTAALAKDPQGVGDALQSLVTRVSTAATSVSDPYSGTLTASITGQQSTVQNLTDSISNWDDRLADRRATLEKTYAALETQLSSLKSQSSWLTSQLSSLSSSSSSSGSSS
jgi:flagellar hook-associated protein 2